MTPGEEFECENELADKLIEQGRATLVDDQGRTPAVVEEPVVEQPVVTPKRSKVTLEAEIAADEAALATAESEGLAAPVENA